MKYRLTPLHAVAAYLVYWAVYYFIVLDWKTAELGGLTPFILIGFAIVTLLVDLVIQRIWYKDKRLLYWIESLLIFLIVYWYIYNFGFTNV